MRTDSAPGPRVLDEVREWSAWRNASAVLRQAIGDFYTRPCALGPGSRASEAGYTFAAVELTGKDVTFELVLGVDRTQLRELAASMLGTADEEDAISLLLETSNIAMGRFQAALMAEGVFSKLGLPRAIAARRMAELTSHFHASCRGVAIEVSLSCMLKVTAIRPFTLA